jgi:hypothetical protein
MKIIFFNHFHRGDLVTHKEFVRHIKQLLPNNQYEYWHFNHPKVNLDLQIPLTNIPNELDQNVVFYENDDVLAINTWIGVWGNILPQYNGINIETLYESWKIIFDKLNLKLHEDREEYLPTIDYSFFNLEKVNSYLQSNQQKRILICNGKPMSNQSFDGDMREIVTSFASSHPNIDFICTKKFENNLSNILFTDDIIDDQENFLGVNPAWNDRISNTCDLNEISYLSTKCNAIIGKNSGPFVFCETKQNFKDQNKVFVSFCNSKNESMSNGVNLYCRYRLVKNYEPKNIIESFGWVISQI